MVGNTGYDKNLVDMLDSKFAEKLVLYQGPSASIYVGPDRVLFTAPKALLIQQSRFFQKALGGSFKEAATDEINFPLFDPDAFKYLMHYIHCGDLKIGFAQKRDGITSRWLFDTVNKESLKEEATRLCWTLCHIYYHADNLMMVDLMENICDILKEYLEDLYKTCLIEPLEADLIQHIFDNTLDGSSLQQVVLDEVTLLLTGKKGRAQVDPKKYNVCFITIPDFAAKVVRDIQEEMKKVEQAVFDAQEIHWNPPEPSPQWNRGQGRGRGAARGNGPARRGHVQW